MGIYIKSAVSHGFHMKITILNELSELNTQK